MGTPPLGKLFCPQPQLPPQQSDSVKPACQENEKCLVKAGCCHLQSEGPVSVVCDSETHIRCGRSPKDRHWGRTLQASVPLPPRPVGTYSFLRRP